MAPELMNMRGTVLEKADRVAGILLEEQTLVNEAAADRLAQVLPTIRARLGYDDSARPPASDLVDTRIASTTTVISPRVLATALPLSQRSEETTRRARAATADILVGQDDRLAVIAGPCSVHDPEAALEYAARLGELGREFEGDLQILMRAYFEKPRTELGWKGFIYDPYLDGSHRINTGLVATRLLMARITHDGVPVATERLNANTPQYMNGQVAYDAIGARNTMDQKAREYASGTSSPVGFKNTPEGGILAAVEAVIAANAPHDFLGINTNGTPMQVTTTGNPLAHVILRGSQHGPNYSAEHIDETVAMLRRKHLMEAVVVDASHGNSGKDHRRQIEVIESISRQVALGQRALKGVMIESHIVAGRQPHSVDQPGHLEYGQSITDACVDLEETRTMFGMLAQAVRERRRTA